MIRAIRHLVPVLCLTGLLAAPAQAAMVSYSDSHTGLTDVTALPLEVARFDASLGVLNSATFRLVGAMTSTLTVISDGSARVVWDKQAFDLGLQGDAGYASLAISASDPGVKAGSPSDPFFNITTSPQSFSASVNADQTFNITGAGLAPFIGPGSLSFFLTTLNFDSVLLLGLQSGGVPSNAGSSMVTTVTGEVFVTYDYSPVPAPAALLLLASGLGLLGVGTVRRRHTARG